MKMRSTNLLSAACFIALFVVIAASGQGGSEYLIKKDSVGGVRLGMAIAEAKNQFTDAEFNQNGEDGQIIVRRRDKVVMMITPETTDENFREIEVTSSSKIIAIKVIDPRYKTAAGVYPGMTIVAAEKVMGKIGRMTLAYGETEYADFTNQPAGVRFEYKGTNSRKAGIYDIEYPDPREQFATKFTTGAYIYSIKVNGRVSDDEPAASANFSITKTSAGDIRLGTTIAEARSAMKGMTFERTSDGEGVALVSVKQGDVQLMTLYADEADPQRPIDETARIMNIEVWDQRFKTAAGIHPKMKFVEVEKVLGKVKKIIRSEIESREYAEFLTNTGGFIYRLMGPNFEAGIYPKGMRETTRYVANTYIYTISIAQERSPDAVE